MKKILLSSILLISSTLLFSQTKYGFKFGTNLAKVEIKQEGSDLAIIPPFNITYHVGGFVESKISRMFSFRPEFLISNKGYKINNSEIEDGVTLTTQEKINILYFEVPVNLMANFDAGSGNFFIGGGPYFGYGFSANDFYTYEFTGSGVNEKGTDNEKIKFGNNEDEIKPFDIGLNFLTGYGFKSGLFLAYGYSLGLDNLSNSEGEIIKNRVISFSLGYKF